MKTKESILNLIASSINVEVTTLSCQDVLDNIPGWSSIAYVMVIAEIESLFGIKLSGDDLFDVETIDDLIALVDKMIEQK